MSSAAAKTDPAIRTSLSPEQYLAMERESETKHEYDRGRIIAMGGASREHNLIGGNIARAVGNPLVDRPCEVYSSDMRVRLGEGGPYVYPDVAAVCGDPQFEDGKVDTLLNPTLIVEVLSPSTERRDRGRKFDQYRTIDSLQEYVMVAQDEVRIERYARREGEWRYAVLDDPDATLRLDSVGCDLPLRQVYAKVTIKAEPIG